jgi:hypothetical protein
MIYATLGCFELVPTSPYFVLIFTSFFNRSWSIRCSYFYSCGSPFFFFMQASSPHSPL